MRRPALQIFHVEDDSVCPGLDCDYDEERHEVAKTMAASVLLLASGNDHATRMETRRAPATSEDDGAVDSVDRKIGQAH